MSAGRPARRFLAATLAAAALVSSACIEDVVVGTQQSPIGSVDAASDASQPLDASAEPDVRAPEPDAAPPEPDAAAHDAGTPPADAAPPDDGGPVVILTADASPGTDAGCDECAPDAAPPLGPCSACDPVSISTGPNFSACPDGAIEVCWENEDNTCTQQCPPTTTCAAMGDCAADQYCFYPKNDCGKSGPGWCAPRPREECSGFGNPVCGCDGKTYQTGCHAVKLGVPILWPGDGGTRACGSNAGG